MDSKVAQGKKCVWEQSIQGKLQVNASPKAKRHLKIYSRPEITVINLSEQDRVKLTVFDIDLILDLRQTQTASVQIAPLLSPFIEYLIIL